MSLDAPSAYEPQENVVPGFFNGRPWPPAAHLVGAESSPGALGKSADGNWTVAMQIHSAFEGPGIVPVLETLQHYVQDVVQQPRGVQRKFSRWTFFFRATLML